MDKKIIKEEFKDYKEYTPKINFWEVEEYEQQFKERVFYDVQFNKEGEEGTSMKLYKGKSGVEATWSGTILLNEDNFIEWSFSLQNGVSINSKLTLNDENVELIPKLYTFYKIWKEEWSKMLTVPAKTEEEPMKASQIQESTLTLREQKQNRKMTIINNYSDRMRKLGGC
jgi:hypothetical protein